MKKLDELHWDRMKDPEYQMLFCEMQKEFDRARALIKARSRASTTQKQVATRMKTAQADDSRQNQVESRMKRVLASITRQKQVVARMNTSQPASTRFKRNHWFSSLSSGKLKFHFMKLYLDLLSPLVFLGLSLFLALILLLLLLTTVGC